MKCAALFAASVVGLASTAWAAPEPTNRQYLVEAKILSLPDMAGHSNLTLTADALTYATNGSWQVGGGTSSAGPLLAELEKDRGVDVLSAPKVCVLANQEATIEICQDVAYFVPETNTLYQVRRGWLTGSERIEAVTNGLFRRTVLEGRKSPGVHLTCMVDPVDAARVRLKTEFTYNLLVETTTLPGTKLKAGAPVIESREIRTAVEMRHGEWVAIGGSQRVRRESDGRKESIIVFLRVTPATQP